MNPKATLALLTVAAVMVVGIFAVNMITRPIILDERDRRENEIYFGIVEEATSINEVTADYILPDEITNVFLMNQDDEPYVYVYQTTTAGFSEGLEFLLFVYADSQAVAGIRILEHNETPEYGGKVLDDVSYFDSLFDASNEQLLSNGIDQVAGATLTIRGLQAAIQDVITYHNDEVVEFVIPDTTAPVVEVLGRNKTFKEGDPVPDYTSYLSVNDDEDDSPSVQIDSSMVDMNTPGEYTVSVTVTDASGNEASTSFVITVVAEEEEIIIEIIAPPAERVSLFEELYPNASLFSDETSQFALTAPVTNIYRIEENETVLAVVYEASFDGFYPDSISMLLFVNALGEVEQLQILDHRESRGYGQDLIADETFISAFVDTTITAQPDVDSYTGATITRDAIVDNVQRILEFHQDTFSE